MNYIKELKLKTRVYMIFLMMIFIFLPKKLYKYSRTSALPSEKGRDLWAKTIEELYEIKFKTNFKIDKRDCFLIMRGDRESKDPDNSVYVNFKVNDINRDHMFATSDLGWLEYYLQQKVKVIFTEIVLIKDGKYRCLNPVNTGTQCKVVTVYLTTNNDSIYIPFGSGLGAILGLSQISNKLFVYGWDFYQKRNLSSMSITEYLFNAFFYEHAIKYGGIFESSLYNLFFADYFDRSNNIIVKGKLDYFKNIRLSMFVKKRLFEIFLSNKD